MSQGPLHDCADTVPEKDKVHRYGHGVVRHVRNKELPAKDDLGCGLVAPLHHLAVHRVRLVAVEIAGEDDRQMAQVMPNAPAPSADRSWTLPLTRALLHIMLVRRCTHWAAKASMSSSSQRICRSLRCASNEPCGKVRCVLATITPGSCHRAHSASGAELYPARQPNATTPYLPRRLSQGIHWWWGGLQLQLERRGRQRR